MNYKLNKNGIQMVTQSEQITGLHFCFVTFLYSFVFFLPLIMEKDVA